MKIFRSGFSLAETSIFIGVSASLAVGGVLAYNQYSATSKIEQDLTTFTVLKDAAENISSISQNFEGVDTQEFINSGRIPSSSIDSGRLYTANGHWGTVDLEVDQVSQFTRDNCIADVGENYCLTENGTAYFPDENTTRVEGNLSKQQIREKIKDILSTRIQNI